MRIFFYYCCEIFVIIEYNMIIANLSITTLKLLSNLLLSEFLELQKLRRYILH